MAQDFNSSFIANSVFNAFLSCTAIMLNILTMLALRKTSSLPKNLKTLLFNLAVSDLGVGLLAQPLYIARLVMAIEQNTETETFNITYDAYRFIVIVLTFASFFGIVALSGDRFLAIHLHLRYQELVTRKRVVAVVISLWVFSAFLATLTVFSWAPVNVTAIIEATIEGVCFLTTGLFYFKIYLAVRHHSHAMQVPPQAQDGDAGALNFARLIKSAVGTFYVYLVFLVCYLPNLCVWVINDTIGPSTVRKHLSFYTFTLLLLNSSLNPLVYCWRMRDIRNTVMEILRNIFPSHN